MAEAAKSKAAEESAPEAPHEEPSKADKTEEAARHVTPDDALEATIQPHERLTGPFSDELEPDQPEQHVTPKAAADVKAAREEQKGHEPDQVKQKLTIKPPHRKMTKEQEAERDLAAKQAKFSDKEAADELERVRASIAESLEKEKADHVAAERAEREKRDAETWKTRIAQQRAEKGFGGSAKKPTAPKPDDTPDSSEQERAAKEAALPPQDGRASVFDPAPGKTETDVIDRLEARANGEFGNEQVASEQVDA